MHAFGPLKTATSIHELDEKLLSCTHHSERGSSENVEKPFENIQNKLTTSGETTTDDISVVPDEPQVQARTQTHTPISNCEHI